MKKLIITVCLIWGITANAAITINSGVSFETGFSPNGNSLAVVLTGIESAKNQFMLLLTVLPQNQ
ncbi:hypothetical protein [Aquella oligotrophica]|uniref:hypothetical protein n=1 Tax=Aquella oligotrophica TaxID=2067065 RepID=UPI001C9A077A|nr:hypothetical protein [Aquella oligotrophica]